MIKFKNAFDHQNYLRNGERRDAAFQLVNRGEHVRNGVWQF